MLVSSNEEVVLTICDMMAFLAYFLIPRRMAGSHNPQPRLRRWITDIRQMEVLPPTPKSTYQLTALASLKFSPKCSRDVKIVLTFEYQRTITAPVDPRTSSPDVGGAAL